MRSPRLPRTMIATAALSAVVMGSPALADTEASINADSTVLGGYAATGGFRNARATFVVPTVECSGGRSGVLTELVAYDDEGGVVLGGAVSSTCRGGASSYEAMIITRGEPEPLEGPVAAGDVILVSIESRRGSISVDFENQTQSWGMSLIADGSSPILGSVHVGDARFDHDGSPLPVSDFGRHGVRHVRIGHESLADVGAQALTLVDEDGEALIEPSRLRGGSRFTLTSVG